MKEDLIALGRPKKNAVQTSNIGMAASIDRDFAMLGRSAGCFISCLRGSLGCSGWEFWTLGGMDGLVITSVFSGPD